MTPAATAPEPTPATMNKRQAAAYIGCSVRSLDRLPIPRVNLLPGKVFYRRSTLDSFLASRETPPESRS